MNSSTIQLRGRCTLLLSVMVGGLLLTSCSSGSGSNEAHQEQMPDVGSSSVPAPASKTGTPAQVTRAQPQLVKKAELALVVNSLDRSIGAASEIVKKQQGDVLGLQEQNSQNNSIHHTASIESIWDLLR